MEKIWGFHLHDSNQLSPGYTFLPPLAVSTSIPQPLSRRNFIGHSGSVNTDTNISFFGEPPHPALSIKDGEGEGSSTQPSPFEDAFIK